MKKIKKSYAEQNLVLSYLISALCFNSCGGVEVYNDNGKIKVSNTLESRIDLISHQVEHLDILPEIQPNIDDLHDVVAVVSACRHWRAAYATSFFSQK